MVSAWVTHIKEFNKETKNEKCWSLTAQTQKHTSVRSAQFIQIHTSYLQITTLRAQNNTDAWNEAPNRVKLRAGLHSEPPALLPVPKPAQ
jgi:hypothetical protein